MFIGYLPSLPLEDGERGVETQLWRKAMASASSIAVAVGNLFRPANSVPQATGLTAYGLEKNMGAAPC